MTICSRRINARITARISKHLSWKKKKREVDEVINLDKWKETGPDDISSCVFREGATELVGPLHTIFQNSLIQRK